MLVMMGIRRPRFPVHIGDNMDRRAEVIALLSNAVLNSLVILNKCLLDNGGLLSGQFSQALKDTFQPS